MWSTHFAIKDLGRPAQFLTIELEYGAPHWIGLWQTTALDKLLSNQGMQHAEQEDGQMNPAHDFSDREVKLTAAETTSNRIVVESILHLVTKTQPDTCVCSSIMESLVQRPGPNDILTEDTWYDIRW